MVTFTAKKNIHKQTINRMNEIFTGNKSGQKLYALITKFLFDDIKAVAKVNISLNNFGELTIFIDEIVSPGLTLG